MKNLLISTVVLGLLVYLTGSVKSADPYIAVGQIFGVIFLPLFNAHLTGKYLSWDVVKKYPLPIMLMVGTVSLLFVNSVLVFLVIIGSIVLNKITRTNNSKKKQ